MEYKTSKPMFNMDTKFTQWLEYREEPGVVYKRSVIATEWIEHDRNDCFCCSCPDVGASDHACRNHGFYGRRPCEFHNLPGLKDEDGVMPHSVQKEGEINR